MFIGKRYKLVQPAYYFESNDGLVHDFPELVREVEILPKPSKVKTFDGFTEKTEPLPHHFTTNDWYWVRNLKLNRTHWVNVVGYHITEL